MSILKTIVLSQVLVANGVHAANEVGGIKGGDESIEKNRKSLKTRKLSKGLKSSKSGNSKGKKSAKSEKLSKSQPLTTYG